MTVTPSEYRNVLASGFVDALTANKDLSDVDRLNGAFAAVWILLNRLPPDERAAELAFHVERLQCDPESL